MSSKDTPILSTRKHLILSKNLSESQYQHNDLTLKCIWQTISELEYCLIEDQRQDHKLRMALDRQTERVLDLHACLKSEKERNRRLADLILEEDSWPPKEEDYDTLSKASYVSISPLLMQQRYEDLCSSYNLCRKKLIKRDRELKIKICEREMLQSKYDSLLDEYKQSQKSLEQVCVNYLSLQKFKNYKIHYLQEALSYASNCLILAQKILATANIRDDNNLTLIRKDFQQNLREFLNNLQLSDWIDSKCNIIE